MYFIHPQIKFNLKNLKKTFLCFFGYPDTEEIERVKKMFPGKEIVFTDMARSAFKAVIEKLKLQNTEMIFPAYICDVFYPILKKYNIKPIFVDIKENTFSYDLEQLKEKVTEKTKSILACHIYGLPIDIQEIREATNNQLLVIEDCAHSLLATKDDVYTGNAGDVAIFSIYKQFPTFRGGMLVYPKEWEVNLPATKFSLRDVFSFLNSFQLFAYLFKIFGRTIAPKVIRKEKFAKPAGINPISLNAFSRFFKDYENSLKNRIELALFYQEELKKLNFQVQNSNNNVFCYLSALAPKNINRDKFVERLRVHGVFCTRIWHTPIVLNPRVQKECNLGLNEFPNTTDTAKRIINFPLQNHYSKEDIEKILKDIKKTLTEI